MEDSYYSLFKGTYKYYVKYRPEIPEKVIQVIADHFYLKITDRILDIGCGTGQVARAFKEKCKEIVNVDADPEMLRWAKKITKSCKTKLVWVNCRAENLMKIKDKLGVFKIATCSRAFHHMNQEKVLENLDRLIKQNGGVALFSDRALWNGKRRWQKILKEIVEKYSNKVKSFSRERSYKTSNALWENVLRRSVFKKVKTYEISVVRKWDIQRIIGYLLSTSVCAPPLFGNKIDDFKEDVRKTLFSLNPKGIFQEKAVWSVVLGSRKEKK
ncbi:class I SAM-dependent methyltransferase [bacterium]|nr:class I SAM-dependent methyltransferase [bacterium]